MANRTTSVQPPPRITIGDVARHCSLSIATVSKVLNGQPNARIPAETRDRVLAAAAGLKYRPSYLARALAKQRSRMIGVLYVPPLAIGPRGVYETLSDELHRIFTLAGYQLIYARLGEHVEQWRQMLTDQLDGCLLIGAAPHDLIEMLAQSHLPCVLVNLQSNTGLSHVRVDDFGGAVQVTRHLLDLGHRRICYYNGDHTDTHYSRERRYSGFCHAMVEAGLTPPAAVTMPVDRFPELLKPSLPDAPTAVITYDHWSAATLLQSLWRHGLRVPHDLSVVTFNNAYPVEVVVPPLTAVALPAAEMGRRAGQMLLDRIEKVGAFQPEDVLLDETLIVRESTAPPRAQVSTAMPAAMFPPEQLPPPAVGGVG